jgi:Probable Zinc-ribbon domain
MARGHALPRSGTLRKPRPAGRLPGGELFYAPLGEMRSDGERVQCHLCGRWFEMVGRNHLLATRLDHRRVSPRVSSERHAVNCPPVPSGALLSNPPSTASCRAGAFACSQCNRSAMPCRRPPELPFTAFIGCDADWLFHRRGGVSSEAVAFMWWRCRRRGHEWRATVKHRAIGGRDARNAASSGFPSWPQLNSGPLAGAARAFVRGPSSGTARRVACRSERGA